MTTTTAHYDGETIEAATWPANKRGLAPGTSAYRGRGADLRVRVPVGGSYRPPGGFRIGRINRTDNGTTYCYIERAD